MSEAFLHAVVGRAVSKGGSVAFLDFADDFFPSFYIEVGVLLAREGSVRQVFRGRAGADGYEGIAVTGLLRQFFIGIPFLFVPVASMKYRYA